MAGSRRLTVEEFLNQRPEFPDGGRWTELHAGEAVHLMPPDEIHGMSVMNVTKALATYVGTCSGQTGYACFELGLVVQRSPDSVHRPAISYFTEGELFANSNEDVTSDVPALIVEMASTSDRRRNMRERVEQYHDFGTQSVWVIDPQKQEVIVIGRNRPVRTFAATQTLAAEPLLPGFELSVDSIFAQPLWWNG